MRFTLPGWSLVTRYVTQTSQTHSRIQNQLRREARLEEPFAGLGVFAVLDFGFDPIFAPWFDHGADKGDLGLHGDFLLVAQIDFGVDHLVAKLVLAEVVDVDVALDLEDSPC